MTMIHRNFNSLTMLAALALLCSFSTTTLGQDLDQPPGLRKIVGSWVINEQLSDDTDERVEVAIKKAGGKVKRSWFTKKEKDRYRGGPEEQELYDRISYDDVLKIAYNNSEFRFEYADGYFRVFHSDGRTRTIGATEFYNGANDDFSFASWEEGALLVEARPADGGYTLETYSLQLNDDQLRVEMEIKPYSFGAAIILVRIYDRSVE